MRPPPPAAPSDPDGDGIRVVATPRGVAPMRAATPWLVLTALVVMAGIALFVASRAPRPGREPAPTGVPGPDVGLAAAGAPASVARSVAGRAGTELPPPGNDPADLATYFLPGDPEPTGAEVITALQASGVRTGLGAFNPPGTSPPLEGLAVPADFALPEGYVRHHQVTDEGVPIEPILMFSPDFTMHDANGRPVAMPPSRVVPPALAPPGLPLRWVRVAKP